MEQRQQDLRQLIIKNDLQLSLEVTNRLLTSNGRGKLYSLSPDKEAGAFMLYCIGNTFEEIAIKLTLPLDLILTTAIQYSWFEKTRLLKKSPDTASVEMQKDLVNSILVATVISMQRSLGEVISGKLDAKDCPLIPNSPAALEKLLTMSANLNAPPSADKGSTQTTVITTQNLQINQSVQQTNALPEKAESRLDRLKALDVEEPK
jgi:hypothetical protein